MTIAKYIERKDTLQNTLFRINENGEGRFVEDGIEYTREQFMRKYPLPMSFVSHTVANSDTKQNWLLTE